MAQNLAMLLSCCSWINDSWLHRNIIIHIVSQTNYRKWLLRTVGCIKVKYVTLVKMNL